MPDMDLSAAVQRIEELTKQNAELLEAKRKANGEAKEYREAFDSLREQTGIDAKKLRETFAKLKTGELTPDELSTDVRATLEKLRPVLVEADSILGKEPAKAKAGKPAQEAKGKPQEAAAQPEDDELQKLRAENQKLKLSQEFIAEGANPAAVEKLLKLWEEPQATEGKDFQATRQEAKAAFKADNPWAFAQEVQPAQAMPQQKPPVVPPHQGAVNMNANAAIQQKLAELQKQGDVQGMLQIMRESGGKL